MGVLHSSEGFRLVLPYNHVVQGPREETKDRLVVEGRTVLFRAPDLIYIGDG